jgi:hypothetical protein
VPVSFSFKGVKVELRRHKAWGFFSVIDGVLLLLVFQGKEHIPQNTMELFHCHVGSDQESTL